MWKFSNALSLTIEDGRETRGVSVCVRDFEGFRVLVGFVLLFLFGCCGGGCGGFRILDPQRFNPVHFCRLGPFVYPLAS